MESILGKILLSAAMCAATGGDPEVEAKRCADEIIEQVRKERDTDVTISYHHRKATDGADICLEGRGSCIIEGLYNLVGSAALRIAGDRERAVKIVESVYEGAKTYIENRGGMSDAQDYVEKVDN